MYNAIGLILFVPLIDYTTKGIISTIVIFNGIMCHGSKYLQLSYSRNLMLHDVCWNVILGLFVLYTEKNDDTKLLILFTETISIFNFCINKIRYNSSALLHVLGIQLPLAISMYHYQTIDCFEYS
tara:strand:- start:1881 stop:2255 length:375 start_codon:yes stop_codon:yes gene_type:complete